jgi:hypothetical protein
LSESFGNVEAGWVDGSEIFVDSSLVDADASNNSLIDTPSLKIQIGEGCKELEVRLEEKQGVQVITA